MKKRNLGELNTVLKPNGFCVWVDDEAHGIHDSYFLAEFKKTNAIFRYCYIFNL